MDKERLGIRKGKLFLWKFKLKFLQMSCSGSKESIQPPNSSVFLSIIDIWCQASKPECPAYPHFFSSFLFLQTYPQFPSRFKHRWLPYCDISKNATLMFNGIKNPLWQQCHMLPVNCYTGRFPAVWKHGLILHASWGAVWNVIFVGESFRLSLTKN